MINLIKIFDYAKEDLWRDIKGYEGLYQVSHSGKVRSLNYKHTGKIQELKLALDKDGYYMVNLYKDGNVKYKSVHRLVAEAFIPNTENKPCIDHRDTNRLNNHVRNLHWCSRKENSNNEKTKCNIALSKLGNKNPKAKKYYLYDKNNDFIIKFDTKGQLVFYLSKFSNYKMKYIENELLRKKSKYTILNTGKIFDGKFYIYDFKLEEAN